MSQDAIRHRQSLDGLRAFAVVAVMLYHAGAPGFAAGWIGVDLFFVLSGFLITSLLLDERQQFGSISLRLFWARRFLRLMPIYILYVCAITLLVASSPAANLLTIDGWTPTLMLVSLWTYTANFVPQVPIWSEHYYLTAHLWSLSVEEQFYFIWPVVLALIAAWRRLPLVALCFVSAVAVANFAAYHGTPPRWMLYSRGIALFVGCTFAVIVHVYDEKIQCGKRYFNILTWWSAGATMIAFLAVSFQTIVGNQSISEILRTGTVVFDLAAALLITSLWLSSGSAVASVLSLRPLSWMGQISYGIYLYHILAWVLTWYILPKGVDILPSAPTFGLRLIVYFSLTLSAAALSYRYIERPFLRLKRFARPEPIKIAVPA